MNINSCLVYREITFDSNINIETITRGWKRVPRDGEILAKG